MARFVVLGLSLMVLLGCHVLMDSNLQATRPSITIASITPDTTPNAQATENPFPVGVYDALPSTVGICFEAAWDAADLVFVLRSAEEHIRFYDLVDNSELCRRPIQREPFDFTTGDVLVGTWNRGTGCTAQHQIMRYERDDTAQTIIIEAQFSTDGDCPYEVVRGLWLGLEGANGYAIDLTVQSN